MAIVRWNSARDLDALQGDMHRLFHTFLASNEQEGRRWVPAMDLFEGEDAYIARFDLPGMREEDLAIDVEGDVLTVTGEREAERSDSVKGWYRFERAHGQFARRLQLPEGIDPEAIEATFDLGVLELRIPKPAQPKPHRVTIGRRAAIEGSEAAS
jgi:HSP20 family protein